MRPARRDNHPRAAENITAKPHPEQFPDRGHAEQHPQWQVSRRGVAVASQHWYHRSTDTNAQTAPRHRRGGSRTSWSTGQQSRLMQDAAAQSPDHPRCNRSSQHAPGPSCDHHPRETDIVTAKAHREQFPDRGHAEQHFQWQNQQAGCGCCATTLVPPQHRHHLASSPATQKGGFTHVLVDSSAETVDVGRRSAKPRSPTVQSIEPAYARPVV